jgi:hypothetical protein
MFQINNCATLLLLLATKLYTHKKKSLFDFRGKSARVVNVSPLSKFKQIFKFPTKCSRKFSMLVFARKDQKRKFEYRLERLCVEDESFDMRKKKRKENFPFSSHHKKVFQTHINLFSGFLEHLHSQYNINLFFLTR